MDRLRCQEGNRKNNRAMEQQLKYEQTQRMTQQIDRQNENHGKTKRQKVRQTEQTMIDRTTKADR